MNSSDSRASMYGAGCICTDVLIIRKATGRVSERIVKIDAKDIERIRMHLYSRRPGRTSDTPLTESRHIIGAGPSDISNRFDLSTRTARLRERLRTGAGSVFC
jgi:hypothetical protein